MCLSTKSSRSVSLYLKLEPILFTLYHLMQCRNKELILPSCRSTGTDLYTIIPIVDTLHLHITIIVKLLVAILIKIFYLFNNITSYWYMHSHHARLTGNLNNGCRLLLLSCRFIKVLESIVSAFESPFIIFIIFTYNTYTFDIIH